MSDFLDEIESGKDKWYQKIDISASLLENVPKISTDEYGICATCVNFTLIKTKFGKSYTECEWHKNIVPNTIDPIIFCLQHSPRNQLSLRDMWALATIIDNKNKVGFDV